VERANPSQFESVYSLKRQAVEKKMQIQNKVRQGNSLRKTAVQAVALLAIPTLIVTAVIKDTQVSQAQSKAAGTKSPIKWQPSLNAALKEAKRTGKPIFIDFYADWCGPCKMLDKAYFKPALKQESSRWIMVKIDADKDKAAVNKYDVSGLPTMLFLDSNGKIKARKTGFKVEGQVTSEEQLINFIARDVTKSMQWSRTRKA
jgi:thiol:disulfide interchange protein